MRSELSLLDDHVPWEQRVLSGASADVEAHAAALRVRCRCNPPSRRVEEDYELTSRPLQAGSDGEVFFAVSVAGGPSRRKFAVKCVPLIDASLADLARLRSEVSVFLCADHPHLATLHDVYESESHLYLVMEHLEGGDLFTRIIQRHALSEGEAATFTRQILLALGFLHRTRAAHRSLKPQNICFDKAGGCFLKLCGFGSSVIDLGGGRESNEVRQQHDFHFSDCSAPEMLRGAPASWAAGELCDLWSVGVITFFLLSGGMPFRQRGDNLMQLPGVEVQGRILSGSYTTKSSIPASARSFIQTMLSSTPGARGTVKHALSHSWFASSCTALPQGPPLSVLNALTGFPLLPRLRRCCLLIVAWSLASDEHALVRDSFLSLSSGHKGTIALAELSWAFAKAGSAENTALDVCASFRNINGQGGDSESFCCSGRPGGAGESLIAPPEIRYSEFLAAMLSGQLLPMSDHLICDAFRRFDVYGYGYVTATDLHRILGSSDIHPEHEANLQDADGAISYESFATYVRGDARLNGGIPSDSLILTPRDFESKPSRGGCCTTDLGETCVAQ